MTGELDGWEPCTTSKVTQPNVDELLPLWERQIPAWGLLRTCRTARNGKLVAPSQPRKERLADWAWNLDEPQIEKFFLLWGSV